MEFTAEIPLGDISVGTGFEDIHLAESGWRIIKKAGEAKQFRQILVGRERTPRRLTRHIKWTHVAQCKIPAEELWRNALDQTLILLRLFKEGYVVTPFCRILESRQGGCYSVNWYLPWKNPRYREKPLSIARSDGPRLKAHLRRAEKFNLYEFVALRSFSNYYFYPRYVDRLLALATAFDSLLFPVEDVKRDVKSNTPDFARRLLAILKPEHNQSYHEKCVWFFEWRHVVVHGRAYVQEEQIRVLTEDFQRLCRRLIIELMKRNLLDDFSQRKKYLNRISGGCPCRIDIGTRISKVRKQISKKF
ncbi:MAG: hypothetical protein ACE5JS_19870 [Nitrospinota bacterium]